MDASSPLWSALVVNVQSTAKAAAFASASAARMVEVTTEMTAVSTEVTAVTTEMTAVTTEMTAVTTEMTAYDDSDDTEERIAAVGALLLEQCESAGGIAMSEKRRTRLYWTLERSDHWWSMIVTRTWSESRWRRYFRMPRAIFHRLVDILRPELERSDSVMRKAIPVEERVAIAIFMLAHKVTYLVTSELFGVGVCTAGEILLEFALAMEKLLLSRTVYLGDARQIMEGFAELGFPQVVGAVDGCHCLIVPPLGKRKSYQNRKGSYSVILQGTCDHTGRFVDVELGWQGSAHDARVVRNSVIFETMEAGIFVPGNPTITIRGQQIGPLLLGDKAYPLRKWLTSPYKKPTTAKRKLFNRRLNKCRVKVEHAFGRLKARWRCLRGPLIVAEENVVPIIAACVILHNICETKGKVLDEGLQYRRRFVLPTLGAPIPENDPGTQEGHKVRNALADFFQTGRI